jgi:hypothetical protein
MNLGAVRGVVMRVSYTPDKKEMEYLELWIPKCRGNFPLFCEKLLGIKLNKGQMRAYKEFKGTDYPVYMLLCGNRFGKGLDNEEKLLTPSGWIKVGDVKKGDILYGRDGRKTEVTGVFPQGVKPSYRFTFDDGAEIVCDNSHLWSVMTSRQRFRKEYSWKGRESLPNKEYGEWVVRETSEIAAYYSRYDGTPPPKQRYTIPVCEPVEFDYAETNLDPYTVGAILGDGSVRHSFSFATGDAEILSYIPYETRKHKARFMYSIIGIKDKLRKDGILGKYSYEKSVPKEYLINSVGVRTRLLQGLMDTDGTIGKNNVIEFSTTSRQLAEDVKFLVLSLGGKCSISERTTSFTHLGVKKKGRLSYRVSIKSMKINPFRLKRKADRFYQKYTTQDRILLKVEKVGERETTCLMVDNQDKLFLSTDFIVTHNTVYEAMEHAFYNFYKVCDSKIDDWTGFEYKTFNCAPSTMNTRVMLKTILSVLRGQLPIKQKDGSYKMNASKLKYFVDSKGLNNYTRIPDQGPFSIRFSNGSQFWAFTLGQSHGDTIQGDAWMRATYDEFGRSGNPEKEIDDITPRLFQYKGKLEIITTPDIENEEAIGYIMDKKDKIEAGELRWGLFEGSTLENEYVDESDLERATEGMSDDKKAQVMHGRVSLKGATYFDIENVVKIFDENIREEYCPSPHKDYYLGLDTAGGGKDYWAITVLEIDKKFRVKYTYYDNKQQPMFNLNHTKNVIDQFKRAGGVVRPVMDYSNEAGSIYYNDMVEYSPIKYRFGTQKKTGKSTKADLLDILRRAINSGMITSPPNRMLKQQLLTYKGPNDDVKQTTDALMSLALSVYWAYKDYLYGKDEIVIDV